ncbi:hypothetical protein C8R43DRAFT_984400 [Mycena crocata]|nr:hypothetical protein C8R43DRAFT_984400 [Mycena crocata]
MLGLEFGSALVLSCLVLLFQPPAICAQDGQIFEWGFADTDATSLISCERMRIKAKPLIKNGIPPFYMIAFAVGGTPITTFIGTNASDLAWTVQHPVGTQLVLGVVDSEGTSGGIDPPLYTVIEGEETQCIPAMAQESEFTLSANVTDALSTCQPWGLVIRGGTPPYNLTFAALDAPDATNVTLGPEDAGFTYINRVPPQTQMIASVSDVTGRWANGSPFVRTQGSPNIDCLGIFSPTSDTVSSPAQSPSTANPSPSPPPISRTGVAIIAGVCVGILLLACLAIAWILRRPNRVRMSERSLPHIHVDPFHVSPIDVGASPWSAPTSPAFRKSVLPAERTSHISTFSAECNSSQLSPSTSAGSISPTSPQPSSKFLHLPSAELPPPYVFP